MDISSLLKLKSAWSTFTANHPRFPDFLRDVKNRGVSVGTEVTITVSYPDGEKFKAGLKLTDSDLELLRTLNGIND